VREFSHAEGEEHICEPACSMRFTALINRKAPAIENMMALIYET
jgi:hypothetical protein